MDKMPDSNPLLVHDFSGHSLLIVDDMPDNRLLIERYLKPWSIKVHTASSGEEALQIVPQLHPDLILMDIQMPGIDGYEATRRLRQMGVLQPILALTAHSLQEEIQKGKNAGCDMVLTKPVNRQKLLEILQRFLEPPKDPLKTV